MNQPSASTVSSSSGIDFKEIYFVLREKVWLIVTAVLIACAFAGAYIIRTPKVYAAKAIVQVEQGRRNVVKIEEIRREDLTSLEILKTIEQNMANSVLLQRVLETQKFTPGDLGLATDGKTYSEAQLIDALGKSVTVKLMRGTRLISVVAENRNPAVAQKIAQSLVSEYVRSNLEQHIGVSREANKFLMEEADRLKAKLEKSEQALQAYKESKHSVSLEESQNIIVEKLKELNQKLTMAKAERLKLESDVAEAHKLAGRRPEDLMAISSIASSVSVLEQKKKVTEQEGIVASLNQRYLPEHPKLIQAQSLLKELKDELARTILKAAEAIDTSYAAAKATEDKFAAVLKEQEQEALELNKIAIPFNVLAREVESDREMYNSVLTRLKETDITKDVDQDAIRVVEPASVPERPIRPRVVVVGMGGLLAGLLAGIGLCLALHMLDSSLKTVDRAEAYLGLPAIAAIPVGKKVSSSATLSLVSEPNSAVAETFRTLRTSLSLLGSQAERQTFLFTSAAPGEGKSFCSANQAVAFAQQGARTLLIDADLRLPTVGKVFFDSEVRTGVSEYISGNSTLHESIQMTDIENLFVMPAGNRAPNPAELLAGSGFAKLMEEARTKFDRIIVDSPPVHAVSDTLLLLKYVQSVCLVVHAGKTPAKAVARAIAKLAEAGGKPVGFVLNRLPNWGGGTYYYYYSAGSYGKGVYGAPDAADVVN
jgi:capsular exopolysaccharide synthesis family protein